MGLLLVLGSIGSFIMGRFDTIIGRPVGDGAALPGAMTSNAFGAAGLLFLAGIFFSLLVHQPVGSIYNTGKFVVVQAGSAHQRAVTIVNF